jgi:hypothetical protein
MPGLAEKLGLKLLATYVPMTNHQVYAAVEADDANAMREFAFQGDSANGTRSRSCRCQRSRKRSVECRNCRRSTEATACEGAGEHVPALPSVYVLARLHQGPADTEQVARMAVFQMKIWGARDPRHPDLAVKAA